MFVGPGRVICWVVGPGRMFAAAQYLVLIRYICSHRVTGSVLVLLPFVALLLTLFNIVDNGSVVTCFVARHKQAPSPDTKKISMQPDSSCVLFRNNKRSVDEHRRPMPWRYPIPTACLDGTIRNPNSNLECRPLPHVQKRPASVDHIALFHYITRSKEDFERKVARGGGGGKHRNWGHFNRVQKCVPPAIPLSLLHCSKHPTRSPMASHVL